ncbi:MAG: hypothetical protein CMF75_03160, partial [Maricaulis sp.]|nr:hypothetical protein [Maricaulis sp.]
MIRVQEFRVDRYTGSEVEISNGFSINGPGLNYQYAEGQNFPYGGRTHLYDQDMHFFRMGTLGVVFDEAGRVQDKVLNLASYGPPVFLIYTFQTDSQSGDVGLIESERRNVAADGQNFEIIYSGMGSGSIRLNYREFTNNDMARQAFFQELSYPVG